MQSPPCLKGGWTTKWWGVAGEQQPLSHFVTPPLAQGRLISLRVQAKFFHGRFFFVIFLTHLEISTENGKISLKALKGGFVLWHL